MMKCHVVKYLGFEYKGRAWKGRIKFVCLNEVAEL